MKILSPSHNIYETPTAVYNGEVNKYIEQIGRVCYKSEDKITDDSATKFVGMLRDNKHWAMLEHYLFTVRIPASIANMMMGLYRINDPILHTKLRYMTIFTNIHPELDKKYQYGIVVVSATTLNYINEIISENYYNNHMSSTSYAVNYIYIDAMSAFIHFMYELFPDIINDIIVTSNNDFINAIRNEDITRIYNREDMYKEIVHQKSFFELRNNCVNDTSHIDACYHLLEYGLWYSVKFTVNRGVTHELVRHRPASYAQESTRYCNYSGAKFGKEISVIKPIYFNKKSEEYKAWETSCKNSEEQYFKLLEMGVPAQQARGVLPTDLKADIVCTAPLGEWLHIFDMRCDSPAHPQIREVMCPLYTEMRNIILDNTGIDLADYHKTNVVPYENK